LPNRDTFLHGAAGKVEVYEVRSSCETSSIQLLTLAAITAVILLNKSLNSFDCNDLISIEIKQNFIVPVIILFIATACSSNYDKNL